MRLANFIPSSIVNGDGCRIVVVFQGCTLDCPMCFSKELQPVDGGKRIDVDDLVQLIGNIYDGSTDLIDGITLSGGNPNEQPEFSEFLIKLKRYLPNLNIWMWSGYTWDEINEKEELKKHLRYLNVVVSGRFINSLKTLSSPYYGSTNQEVWRKTNSKWKKDD